MKARAAVSVVCLVVWLISCHQAWPPGVAARWDGGQATLTEIESFLAQTVDPKKSGTALTLEYKTAAEEMCVRDRLVHHRAAELDTSINSIDKELLHRKIAVSTFVRGRINPAIFITPEDIESYYQSHPESFHRPERRFVEHIYRRTGGETDRESARELLNKIRARYLAGDAFHTLAVEYSQSETAAYGGSLGLISRGDLTESAEQAVFSLEVGEISQPTPVHGGLAVFIVTQIYPEKTFPLEDVKNQIANELRSERQRGRLDAIADENPLPETVQFVPEDSFQQLLETNDPDVILYRDNSLVLSVHDWRERLSSETASGQLTQYVDFLRMQRVYHYLLADGFLDEPGAQEMIDAQLNTTIDDHLFTVVAKRLLTERAAAEPERLRTWYEENRPRYQSPIQLLVDVLSVKPTTEVENLESQLRSVATSYRGGDLEKAIPAINNVTVSRSWMGIPALDAYHPRVKAELLDLQPPACGPVLNIAGKLYLFCIEDRKDPEQLSFDEAREQVLRDYVTANEQELYAELKAEILDEANFEFNEALVREVLHAPSDNETS